MIHKLNYRTISVVLAFLLLLAGAFGVCFSFLTRDNTVYTPREKLLSVGGRVFGDSSRAEAEEEEKSWLERNPAGAVAAQLHQRVTASINSYAGKQNIINSPLFYLYGTAQRLMGKETVYDEESTVYRLKNGYLSNASKYGDYTDIYQTMAELSVYAAAKGIPCLNVVTADKEECDPALFPDGTEDGYPQMKAEYLAVLDEKGAPYLDTAKALQERNPDLCSWFYRTDHHWNVHAGLAVSDEVYQWLSDTCGIPYDPAVFDEESFECRLYKDSFLGSLGRKTKLGYAEAEDFEQMVPLYPTDYEARIGYEGTVGRDGQVVFTGDYWNALVCPDFMDTDIYRRFCYSSFFFGLQDYIHVTNNLATNDLRVMVLKQSKAHCVCPYLAYTVKEMDVLDLRYFPDDLCDFIEKTKPDVILTMYAVPYPNYTNNNMTFDFDFSQK